MSLRVAVLGQFSGTLHAQLAEVASALDLVLLGQAPDTRAATAVLDTQRPDLAIVATRLTDGSGFALIRSLAPAHRPAGLIFVGTSDEEAVSAFELQATDFVLWPTAAGRLEEAVGRARQQALQLALLRTADELQRLLAEAGATSGMDLAALFRTRGVMPAPAGAATGTGGDAARARRAVGAANTGTLVASSPWRGPGKAADGRAAGPREASDEAVLDLSQEDGGRSTSAARPLRVLVREGRRTRFVPLADVDWFEADGNYIRVHTAGERYRTRGTITAIDAALDPRQFVRIHRRVVVNMDRVREMTPLPGGDGLLVLGDGTTLRLSRTYRSRVR
ncbi:MAG: LytR/AlgR family response regulator transcription factor [Gemmatimonas sp.]|jgi:two-component system LytT family response regulator|uniref:LytR/AlgR family response regulator transcription factor n=1 Tax=Gemmatimonas sp. TaxID=1962908 RepID=UPI0022BAD82B|nr:LytTR family DNA-binding domain-containing protein [Gemmatimonas sp.]MCA2984327.1 response regulator transcription factor [Gemmatimonas sp.]MCA2987388.1 response regulator transcription factor [Gemmatimonas sp.]MCA2996857.1 response regulator transcription factor [Gemmatimonas sp.]MCE2955305.1 response regulator transcription factor [Gemmatimonas sp.]MCZ8011895.1 LytTR family DNA-binding domain-containing protein [Gemmatimonas sp.]